MPPPIRKCISTNSAHVILFGGFVVIIALYGVLRFAFDFSDHGGASRIFAGLFLIVVLVILGAFMTAVMIIGPKSQLLVDWRDFVRLSIDFALLPITMPVLLFLCLKIGHTPITYLATPWFGEGFASILGFEFGWFVVLIAVPYAPFVWPILHRERRSRTADGYLLAPKTWMVVCGFALFSVVIIFARPPIELWIIGCGSWLFFSALYHWLLLPRFPRFNPQIRGFKSLPNAE